MVGLGRLCGLYVNSLTLPGAQRTSPAACSHDARHRCVHMSCGSVLGPGSDPGLASPRVALLTAQLPYPATQGRQGLRLPASRLPRFAMGRAQHVQLPQRARGDGQPACLEHGRHAAAERMSSC